jgi:CHAD domain-containing protein
MAEASAGPAPAIELEFLAADATVLARLPMLAALRDGRARTRDQKIVWHDTADGALARQGLSLSENRGAWRLERLHPDAGAEWLPATPAPCLETATAPEKFGRPLPGPLTPTAAFSGRQREIPLTYEGASARLTIQEGTLRGVLHDQPVCRLVLSGEPRAMAGLAAALSRHVTLRPPLCSLAAEAFAVAKGVRPAPRRLGAPRVMPHASGAEALCAIVAHLADVILYWGAAVPSAATPEPVHQMRVAVRRLRSALSVFRRALPEESAWQSDLAAELKSLARALGAARDWDVFLAETGADIERAFAADRRIAAMLTAAGKKRSAAYADLRNLLTAEASWRRLSLTLALLPSLRPWEDGLSFDAAGYACKALDRRLKHVLAAGDRIDHLPPEDLHELRKHAKQLRYAIEFFAPLFPEKSVRKYLSRLETLQEDFGAMNDTAVAAHLASGLGGGTDRAFAAGAVQGFGAARVARAAKKLHRSWAKFYRETPFWS